MSATIERLKPSVVRVNTEHGHGSGVIVAVEDTTAIIVTNQHVVQGETVVKVIVRDKDEFTAKVLGMDERRDLAVLSISGNDFQAVPLGGEPGPNPGDDVVSLGYPLDFTGAATATRGIVSAVRLEKDEDRWVIQTDAAINPGNSGGPMFSLVGEVLGINTYGWRFSRSGVSLDGMGFAVSAYTVRQQLLALRTGNSTRLPRPEPEPDPAPDPIPVKPTIGLSGELWHNPDIATIKVAFAGVALSDFVAEGIFINPYAASQHPWSHGFFLGQTEGANHLRVVISSDGRWSAGIWNHTINEAKQEGDTTSLAIGEDERNHVRVVAIGERGWLFINGEFVAALNLTGVPHAGYAGIGTGFIQGTELAGAVTRYEGFKCAELNLRHGPDNGVLEKSPGKVNSHDSGVKSRDVVVEAEFSATTLHWDCGLVVREDYPSEYEAIGIRNGFNWFHMSRNETGDGYIRRVGAPFTPLPSFTIMPLAINLLLIAIGIEGWFFLNGILLGKVDLSDNLTAGDVRVIANLFPDSTATVEFTDFSVWAPSDGEF